jgi:tRNA threonylcarbamoyladenosine biosynthesis protein TsaE
MPSIDLPSDDAPQVNPSSPGAGAVSSPLDRPVASLAARTCGPQPAAQTGSPCAEPLRRCELTLADEAATRGLAARLAASLKPGLVVWLCGTLGAGKTTLVRALLRALGHTGPVRSPTFTLLEPYDLTPFAVYHFDLYRFSSAHEWRDAGFDDYFGGQGVCVLEWPEQAAGAAPAPDVRIALAFSGEPGDSSGRRLTLDACTQAGLQCVNAILDDA